MEALVFAIHDCGYIARSALEAEDSAEVRIDKIAKIIKDCRYGIHDISRTEVGADTGLPRFSIPLKLGLILDRARYRYQQFCSDIAGQDIRSHDDLPETAIKVVRNWLQTNSPTPEVLMPGGSAMARRFTTLIAAWLSENAWWDGEEERSIS